MSAQPLRLAGRRALVTGGSGGLGSSIALALATAGAEVCVHGRHSAAVQAVVDELKQRGHHAVGVTADLTDPDAPQHVVDTTVNNLGGLDILVNNAGMTSTSNFLEMPVEDWRQVLETNLTSYFAVGQLAARHMVHGAGGSIINVSSTRQQQSYPGSSAYATSKAGIGMLTRSMALELAPLGVRVNSIAPGTIVTGLNRDYALDEDFKRKRLTTIPLGRYGETDEVGGAVVFLASEDASFIVGANLFIDGGQSLW